MRGKAPVRVLDSHCHLTDARFDDDRDHVLRRAREAGVEELVTVGSHPEDARRALDLARRADGVWSTAGLHPHEANRFSDALLTEIEELCGAPEVVAVGETGLDHHYDNAPRATQHRSFRAHLELAARLELPVVVHSREADRQTAELVEAVAGRVTGVLHCFTGGLDLLQTAVEAGWHVSFSGIATFGSFDAASRVERVPDDRLLVETDSPYLAPVPERGGRNEPAFVVHTCRCLAELRGEPWEETAALTRRNARALYGLDAR